MIPTLDIDKFNRPNVYEGERAKAELLTNLMFMEKGKVPTNYDMGIDIKSKRFKIINESKMEELKDEIIDQVNKYIPALVITDVTYSIDSNNEAKMYIETDGNIIKLDLETNNDGVMSLSDIQLANDLT